MLTQLTNVALVQIIQFWVLAGFVVLAVAAFSARLHLPKTRCEPVIDFLLVMVLLIYGFTLRIYFST